MLFRSKMESKGRSGDGVATRDGWADTSDARPGCRDVTETNVKAAWEEDKSKMDTSRSSVCMLRVSGRSHCAQLKLSGSFGERTGVDGEDVSRWRSTTAGVTLQMDKRTLQMTSAEATPACAGSGVVVPLSR